MSQSIVRTYRSHHLSLEMKDAACEVTLCVLHVPRDRAGPLARFVDACMSFEKICQARTSHRRWKTKKNWNRHHIITDVTRWNHHIMLQTTLEPNVWAFFKNKCQTDRSVASQRYKICLMMASSEICHRRCQQMTSSEIGAQPAWAKECMQRESARLWEYHITCECALSEMQAHRPLSNTSEHSCLAHMQNSPQDVTRKFSQGFHPQECKNP